MNQVNDIEIRNAHSMQWLEWLHGFMFTPIPRGFMIQFDKRAYFSNGLVVQPPTSWVRLIPKIWNSTSLSPIILVQWKMAGYLKGNYYWGGPIFHFHDYGRKCSWKRYGKSCWGLFFGTFWHDLLKHWCVIIYTCRVIQHFFVAGCQNPAKQWAKNQFIFMKGTY